VLARRFLWFYLCHYRHELSELCIAAVVNGGAVNGRCGPGTRTPFIVISPWAKANYVDHTQITQASVVKFIEDNWLGSKRLGQGSFDATAGDIRSMLNLTGSGNNPTVFLDPSLGTKLAAAPSSN